MSISCVQFGSEVTDNSIFSALPKYWENEYFKDMEALDVSWVYFIISAFIE